MIWAKGSRSIGVYKSQMVVIFYKNALTIAFFNWEQSPYCIGRRIRVFVAVG